MDSLTKEMMGFNLDMDIEGDTSMSNPKQKGKKSHADDVAALSQQQHQQPRVISKQHRKQGISKHEQLPIQQQQQESHQPKDHTMPTPTQLQESIQKVLEIGTKPWRRSKIMLVGEGRAGKTALANSILGKDFADTASTVGINQLTCDIKYAAFGDKGDEGCGGVGRQWNACDAPKNLLETSVAQMLAGPPPSTTRDFNKQVMEQEDAESMEVGYLDADGLPTAEPLKLINISNSCSPPPPFQPCSIDNELVMQRLSSEIKSNSKYIISLFDFGGQSVFNVIHPFFLTQHGVYIVVFNMEWLLNPEKIDYQHCLDYLTFWINSIIIHTQTTRTKSGEEESEIRVAPWVLVGTRRDKVIDPHQHEAISLLLYNTFGNSIAWPYLIENENALGSNGTTNLVFFPVDNTLGKDDTTLSKLLFLIEKVIDQSDYVHMERPLTWCAAADKLTTLVEKSAVLNWEDVIQVAVDCAIPFNEVPTFLTFLHKMGILMWHREEALRDVVILDPVQYFVTPATTIICKHAPTQIDATYHSLEAHKRAKKKFKADWDRMIHQGIISKVLIDCLLEDCAVDHRDKVIMLMVKYGLLVPYKDNHEKADNDENTQDMLSFVAPVLLPTNTQDIQKTLQGREHVNSFHFVFMASRGLESHTTVSKEDCQALGFLPTGLFERLICKLISSSHSTLIPIQILSLYKNQASFTYGDVTFHITLNTRNNMVTVYVEGSPIGVHRRLKEIVQDVIQESMKTLKFITLLALESDVLFIRLQQVFKMQTTKTALNLLGSGGRKMNPKDLFADWLIEFQLFSRYDIFISYRWNKVDSATASELFDLCSMFTIGKDNRALKVFLDEKRLKEGMSFQSDFMKALLSSTMVCPIVTPAALEKLYSHNPTEEDNMLMEWILSVLAVDYIATQDQYKSCCKVQCIVPIIFGSRRDDHYVDFFTEGLINKLPTVVPMASMSLVNKVLKIAGIEIPPDMLNMTIQDVVKKVVRFLSITSWTLEKDAVVNLNTTNLKLENSVWAIKKSCSVIDKIAIKMFQSIKEHTVEDDASDSINSGFSISRKAAGAVLVDEDVIIPEHKALGDCSVDEVCGLLYSIEMHKYRPIFKHLGVDGASLCDCESVQELKEIGIEETLLAKKLFRFILQWKEVGV